VAVNSATAALHCAVTAAEVGAGDEVIVTPWSFSASAVAPLMVGAIPVFADIEDLSFGLDSKSVESKITKYTKAIIVVDLFGQPADLGPIIKIARKHKLVVIEDSAQAPLASYNGKLAGTIGDMGIFSFTASKQMTTGEGGMLITNNPTFAKRAQMARNHGEVLGIVEDSKTMEGILGWNYRMTEVEAAIGIEQFKKLPGFINRRRLNADFLNKKLSAYPFISVPQPQADKTHSYFIYAFKYDQKKAGGVHRDLFVKALAAEGIPVTGGYVPPLYWNPVYQRKEFFGRRQYPFSVHPRQIDYKMGICPMVEKLHLDVVVNTLWAHPKLKQQDLNDVIAAVDKVARNLSKLKKSDSK
jgi:dTDP-4-amino-4,6-dideoxygalactose transaminase